MYYVSAQGIDELMINVHYYYYLTIKLYCIVNKKKYVFSESGYTCYFCIV